MAGRHVITAALAPDAGGEDITAPTDDGATASTEYVLLCTPDAAVDNWRLFAAKGPCCPADASNPNTTTVPFTIQRRDFPVTVYADSAAAGDYTLLRSV